MTMFRYSCVKKYKKSHDSSTFFLIGKPLLITNLDKLPIEYLSLITDLILES